MKSDEVNCLKYVIDTLDKHSNGEIVFTNIESNKILLKLLKEVKPNPNKTKFPDSVSNDIIVEHFSITSGKENRKGSVFKQKEIIQNKENEKKIKEWQEDFLKTPFKNNTIKSDYIENIYNDFTYKNFIDSLNRVLKKHIDSLIKYELNNRKVVFLIELQDASLQIYRNLNYKKPYELNKDKGTLDILKQYVDMIDVIIFRANDRLEIIDMKKIDKLYEDSICENDIRGGRYRKVKSSVCIDINDLVN